MRSDMVAAGLLLIALGQLSFAQETAGGSDGSAVPPPPPPAVPPQEVRADVGKRGIVLDCSPPAGTELANILWYKNDSAVSSWVDLAGRYKAVNATFNITDRAREDDFGRYDCRLAAAATPLRAFEVKFNPYARLLSYTNVVEEQKLRLTCRLVGKPYVAVEWRYSLPDSRNFSELQDVSALAGRYRLARTEAGVDGGDLIVEEAAKADAGNYTCAPVGFSNTTYESFTVVLVKDKYAALWPFLGICLEVLVLCVIILVYEKRRPKQELEDSDTDNHDQ